MEYVTVYCGSQVPRNEKFQREAKAFGTLLASKNLTLVFGGCRLGLMGELSAGVEAENGRIIGITIPKFEANKKEEYRAKKSWEVYVEKNLSDRRRKMMILGDAFVALPGGFGTLDELTEVLVEAALSMHQKPIGILNCDDYFGHILAWRKKAKEEGLDDPERAERVDRLLVVKDNAADLLDGLFSKWDEINAQQ